MNIQLGNLRTFTKLGDKEKLQEMEDKLTSLGYSNCDNCEENKNTENLTWHIYETPRLIEFSVLDQEVTKVLHEYSSYFEGMVSVAAYKQV